MCLCKYPAARHIWQSIRSFFSNKIELFFDPGSQRKTIVNGIQNATSFFRLLQSLSCLFKSCRSLTACWLATVIFFSVSLLLFLWVLNRCFISVTVLFLSLMSWLAWASSWMYGGTRWEHRGYDTPCVHSDGFNCAESYLLQMSHRAFYHQTRKVTGVTRADCCIAASRCFICLMVFSHWWMSCCVSRWACCKFSVVLSKAICLESRRKSAFSRHS